MEWEGIGLKSLDTFASMLYLSNTVIPNASKNAYFDAFWITGSFVFLLGVKRIHRTLQIFKKNY